MKGTDYSTYESPFTWRYGSPEMRKVWSEEHKRLLLRRVWVALAYAQNRLSIVSDDELADIEAHQNDIDIEKSAEIEKEIHHDLMAEIRVFSSQCHIGGGKIHLGATSMDILDNAEALRVREALAIINGKLLGLLGDFASQIKKYHDFPVMAWTHIQSAEVTTLGYRFAFYAQDFLQVFRELSDYVFYAKGFKGAVGNASGYEVLLGADAGEMERIALEKLGLQAFEVTTQVYPRSQDYRLLNMLSEIALCAAKFAFDLRMLQSSAISEMGEPFSARQVGSSAMPFKRNPVNAEKINSLSRFVASLPHVAWENAANSILERTLDDSANRRVITAESFIAVDEILESLLKIVNNLRVDAESIRKNLGKFGCFAATEVLLMELVRRGADRQEMHEVLRENSLRAYDSLRKTDRNNLVELLSADSRVLAFMEGGEVKKCLGKFSSLNFASEHALKIASVIEALHKG